MAKKSNFSIKKYKDIIFFLVVAIICVLLLAWVLTTCVEADESNVHTVEGKILNPQKESGTRLSWVSFEIDKETFFVRRPANTEFDDMFSSIHTLSKQETMVTITYPDHKWYSFDLFVEEGGSEQAIRIVDASDGRVYYDYVEEHDQSMKIDRIVFSIILSFLLLVSVGLLALSIYTDIICRSKSKKKPKEQRVRAPQTVLTLEQRKNRAKSRRNRMGKR